MTLYRSRTALTLLAATLVACSGENPDLEDHPGPPDVATIMAWADHDRASASRIETFVANLPEGEAVEQLRTYADLGDPEALVMLGHLLSKDRRVDGRIVEDLFEEAYELGSGVAAYNLMIGEIGKGAQADADKFEEYHDAFQKRMPRLFYQMKGREYLQPNRVGGFFMGKQSRRYFDKATELGDSRSPFIVANHLLGQYGQERQDEALALLELSYERGDYEAGALLATVWMKSEQEADQHRARSLLRELAGQGYPMGQWVLYDHLVSHPGLEPGSGTALDVLNIMVARNDPFAAPVKAEFWLKASRASGDLSDMHAALAYATELAESGHDGIWKEIGLFWLRGEGDADDRFASTAFIRAASAGDLSALDPMTELFRARGDVEASQEIEAYLRANLRAGGTKYHETLARFLTNRDLDAADWREVNALLEPVWDETREPAFAAEISENYQKIGRWDDAIVWSRRAARIGTTYARYNYAKLIRDHGTGRTHGARALVHLRNLSDSDRALDTLIAKIEHDLSALEEQAGPAQLALAEALEEICPHADPLRCEVIWTRAEQM